MMAAVDGKDYDGKGHTDAGRGSEGGKAAKWSGRLCPLRTVLPEGLRGLDAKGREIFEIAVDSGATETVLSPGMLKTIELRDGPASRSGVQYEVADGRTIPNLGEKQFVVRSEEGVVRDLTCQVCEVNKPLLSVHKVVQAGNRVVFEPGSAWIEDTVTGEVMMLQERGGMYLLSLRTEPGPGDHATPAPTSGF